MSTALEIPYGNTIEATLPDSPPICRQISDGTWYVAIGQIEFYTEFPERLAQIRDAISAALDEAQFAAAAQQWEAQQ